MSESSSQSPLSAVDKLIQMATGQIVPPPVKKERPAAEAITLAEATAEAAPVEEAVPVEMEPVEAVSVEEAPVEEAAVEAVSVEDVPVEAAEEPFEEPAVEEHPHRRGFFSFLGHRGDKYEESAAEPEAAPVEEAAVAEPVVEESAPVVEEAPGEEVASETPVEAAGEMVEETVAESEPVHEPFPVPSMEPVGETVAESVAEEPVEEAPVEAAEEAVEEAPSESASEGVAAEESVAEPEAAAETEEAEVAAEEAEPEAEPVEESAAEESASEETEAEKAETEETEAAAEEPTAEETEQEVPAAAAAAEEDTEASYSLEKLLKSSSKRKTRLYGPSADVFPSAGGTTIMKQGAALTDELTEEQLKEMAKDPMWKTLVQHQGWLPVVTSLLPMLDLATGRNQPGGGGIPDDMKESMDGLLISNREVRSTLQGQAVELRRVEEGFGDLRETVDKTAFEQSAMADDLRGVQRLMKNAFLYVGILLGLLVVGVGYMAFLVFTYLNHPVH